MSFRDYFKAVLLTLCFLLTAQVIAAQEMKPAAGDPCNSPADIDEWLNCKVDIIVAARMNQKGANKQVEVPSIADNTTSLVDQTEPPDLFSTALNLAALSSKTGEAEKTSFSVTTTAYALYALANKRDVLDPSFYVRHPDLRRFSFTFGRELPDDEDAGSGERATILGFKFLAINKRDASLPRNRVRLKSVSRALRPAAVEFARMSFEVRQYLYNELAPALGLPTPATRESRVTFDEEVLGTGRMQATLNGLNEKQLARINEIIEERVGPAVALREVSLQTFEEIRRAPQLSFNFQSKLRSEDGIDEYRGGVLFDYGLYRRINLTLNGTFDYEDSKSIGADKRGGRFAAETHFLLTPNKNLFNGKDPLVFSIAGEAKWLTEKKPTYTGQLKLTIPLVDGIEFPLSVSFANRRDLIEEKTVRGRFGFTLDFAKFLKAFNGR
jgi:hypothetical protein